MTKEAFQKKTHIGDGYFHYFKDKNGDIVVEECSQEDYERLGLPGGAEFNPVRKGLTWLYSAGGVVKVDNPDFQLKEGEYVEYGDIVLFHKNNEVLRIPKTDVVNDEIDSSKWQ